MMENEQKSSPSVGLTEVGVEAKKRRKKLFLTITAVNTLISYAAYIVLMQLPIYNVAFFAYLILLAGFSFGYVFYNRGFTRNNVTEEMLPSSWSDEEKFAYVNDAKVRKEKSQWCLTIIFPLVFTFFMDIMYLFIYEPYFAPVLGKIF
jgi:hypothetical protein